MFPSTLFCHTFVSVVIVTFFLVISKDYVFACYSHAGLDSTTMASKDICSDIFNYEQCRYMQNVIKVVIAEFQQKIEIQESNLDQKSNEYRFSFEKMIEEDKLEREKEKLECKKEKSIIVDQIIDIRKKVKLLNVQLKQTKKSKREYVKLNKKDSTQQNEFSDHGERLSSHFHNDNKWYNKAHYNDNGKGNVTSNHSGGNGEEIDESVREFHKMNTEKDVDSWEMISAFLDELIPLMGIEEVIDEEPAGKAYPKKYDSYPPFDIIGLSSKIVRGFNRLRNGFSRIQSRQSAWSSPNAPYNGLFNIDWQNLDKFLKNSQIQSKQLTTATLISTIAGSPLGSPLASLFSFFTSSSATLLTGALVVVGGFNIATNVVQNTISDANTYDIKINRIAIQDLLSTILENKLQVEKNAELAAENRKRLSNVDTSLGFLCSLLDRLYNAETTPRDCCYETHTDSQTGTGMLCLARTTASVFYGNSGTGTCATTCSGLLPES